MTAPAVPNARVARGPVTADRVMEPAIPMGADLTTIRENQELREPFVVSDMTEKQTRSGDPMLVLEFKNMRWQTIGATVFSGTMAAWEKIRKGDCVEITARMGSYQGRPQLNIVGVSKISANHPVATRLNGICPPDRLTAALDGLATHLATLTPGDRRFIDCAFEELGRKSPMTLDTFTALSLPARAEFLGRPCPDETLAAMTPAERSAFARELLRCGGRHLFDTAPAAKGKHHNYLGGNVEHVSEVVDFGVATALESYFDGLVDLSLLRTALILHDIGKPAQEYEWEGVPIDVTPSAILTNHMATGPELADLAFRRHEAELTALGFTEQRLLHVMHVMASHHGRLEYGAATLPKTTEATIAHDADMNSAKMRGITSHIDDNKPDFRGIIPGGRSFRFGLAPDPLPAGGGQPADLAAIRATVRPATGLTDKPFELPDAGTTPVPAIAMDAETAARVRADFEAELAAIVHPGLRALVEDCFTTQVGLDAFFTTPYEPEGPAAYLGSLAEISVRVARSAVRKASLPGYQYRANFDLLRATALLHAIGRVKCITVTDGTIRQTGEGALVPFTLWGTILLRRAFEANRAALEAQGITRDVLYHLQHGMVSHLESPNATPDYGALLPPATFAASIVSLTVLADRANLVGVSQRLSMQVAAPAAPAPSLPQARQTAARRRRGSAKAGPKEAVTEATTEPASIAALPTPETASVVAAPVAVTTTLDAVSATLSASEGAPNADAVSLAAPTLGDDPVGLLAASSMEAPAPRARRPRAPRAPARQL